MISSPIIFAGNLIRKRRPSRPAKWLYPAGIEKRYESIIINIVNEIFSIVKKELIPQLERIVITSGMQTRADAWTDEVTEMVMGMKRTFPSMTRNFSLQAEGVFQKVNTWNLMQSKKVLQSGLGIDVLTAEPWLKDIASAFVQSNVASVSGLTVDIATRIEKVLLNGVVQGRTAESIARSILSGSKDENGVYTMSKKRARFIARDQIGKLNSNLTRFRQTSLGIDSYRWRTMLDPKVRDAHRVREGKLFRWDKPPEGGAPGEDYNCRCYAEPVLDDLFTRN